MFLHLVDGVLPGWGRGHIRVGSDPGGIRVGWDQVRAGVAGELAPACRGAVAGQFTASCQACQQACHGLPSHAVVAMLCVANTLASACYGLPWLAIACDGMP